MTQKGDKSRALRCLTTYKELNYPGLSRADRIALDADIKKCLKEP